MIQRIQTVFLALAVLFNVSVLFTQLGHSTTSDEDHTLSAKLYATGTQMDHIDHTPIDGYKETHSSIPFTSDIILLIHFALVILVSVFLVRVIFLFNDRIRQMKMAYAGAGMLAIQIVLAALKIMNLENIVAMDKTSPMYNNQTGPTIEFFAPAIALLFVWFAARRINKDEKKVRDSDRFR